MNSLVGPSIFKVVECETLRLKGPQFETNQRHCLVSLNNTLSFAKYWFNPGRQEIILMFVCLILFFTSLSTIYPDTDWDLKM